jgi:SAM-dependent methyltransferase
VDAQDWDRRYRESELVWSAEPNRFVAEICADLPVGRALDVACGEGRNAIWLAGLGWQVTGVDFSSAALDKARQIAQRHDADIEWVHADARRIDRIGPGTFDLVVLCYLQVDDAELLDVLQAGASLLTAGGKLVVIAHALENLSSGVGGPQDPSVLPTPERVAQILQAEGLDIDRAGTVLRPVQTPEGQREAVDLVVIGSAVTAE